jgi:transcriptional regulator with XRE-family HTH domain
MVGANQLQVRRIESNKHPASLSLAKAICEALRVPLDTAFPGAGDAVAAFKKELDKPMHVSWETFARLREVGLEGDVRRHTLKVLLSGHDLPFFFPLAPFEASRLFDAVQEEELGTTVASFIIFDSDSLRVAINLKAASLIHFLWDADIGKVIKAEENGEDGDSPAQAVHVYFGARTTPFILIADTEDCDAIDIEQNYLNNAFDMLQDGMQMHEQLHIVDEDGESAFLRVGDITMLTAPLWLLDPDERIDELDDEDDDVS